MGLSSNQARFLTLTARQVDMEQRIQQICQRRLRLSSELENVATSYNNMISNRKMSLANRSNQGIQTLSIANLAALGYKVLGLNTDKVAQRPAVPTSGATVISSQAEFMNIVANLNAGNNLGDTYVLNCDIDLSGTTLTNSLITQNFSGVFDGNGHTISNLNINASSGNNIGLFSTNSGTIRNISLENVNINAANSQDVGSIAGVNTGTIGNVFASGTLSAQVNAGGIVGSNTNLISNTTSTVDVNTNNTNSSIVNGEARAGGFVGTNSGTIKNSSASGDVNVLNGTYNVGGFVACNYGTVDQSYCLGTITAQGSTANVAGFAGGHAAGFIKNCYTTSSLSANSAPNAPAAFVGDNGYSATVRDCYAVNPSLSPLTGTNKVAAFSISTLAGNIDASNFYINDATWTVGSAVNGKTTPLPTGTWNDGMWDKTTTLPTLKNVGYTAYADDLETGLRNGTYSLAREADEFTQEPILINGKSYEEIDWRTTPEIYDELNRGDDVDAENKYDKIISEINAQDKKLQLEQTSVEVEYKAVTSEKEAVKKILDTNAQSSFKYFS